MNCIGRFKSDNFGGSCAHTRNGSRESGSIPADFKRLLKAEAKKVWQLYQGEVIREIYFRGDKTSAVLMLECKDVNEAKRKLSTLPLVESGLIDFELIPLKPYPGFERLFSEKYVE